MAHIRLLVPVAGDIAPGVPAPGLRGVVEVDHATADAWCDGERAELVDGPYVPVDTAQLHADATAYHEAVVAQLHADATAYHDAVVAQLQARVAELEVASRPAADSKPPAKK